MEIEGLYKARQFWRLVVCSPAWAQGDVSAELRLHPPISLYRMQGLLPEVCCLHHMNTSIRVLLPHPADECAGHVRHDGSRLQGSALHTCCCCCWSCLATPPSMPPMARPTKPPIRPSVRPMLPWSLSLQHRSCGFNA